MSKNDYLQGLTERAFINEESIDEEYISIEADHSDCPIDVFSCEFLDRLHAWANLNRAIELNGKLYSYFGSSAFGVDYKTYGYGVLYREVSM